MLYRQIRMDAIAPWTTASTNGSIQQDPTEASIERKPIFMEVFFTLIAILGMTGNGLVLFVFYKVRQLRVTTNILIANQSVVDFNSSLLLFLTFVLPYVNLADLDSTNHTLANFICKIWFSEYIYWALTAVSTTNLVFITLERYFAVKFPHAYRERANQRNTFIVCGFAWLLGALIKVYFLFTRRVIPGGDCSSRGLAQQRKQVIGYLTLVTTIVIPLGIMLFSYTSIIQALKPQKHDSNDRPPNLPSSDTQTAVHTVSQSVAAGPAKKYVSDPQETEQPQTQAHLKKSKPTAKERARRNVLSTMFIVCVTYLVCWTPNQVLYFHHNVVHRHNWTEPFHRFTILLAASNVCTNPIIYTLKYRSFQTGLRKVFRSDAPSSTGLSSLSGV